MMVGASGSGAKTDTKKGNARVFILDTEQAAEIPDVITGEANVVADALSRKEHEKPKRVRALRLELKVDLASQIKEAQKMALEEGNIKAEKENGTIDQLSKGSDEILRLGTRICAPMVGSLRDKILEEAHKLKYMMHPGSDKMYHNLKDDYWWIGMKKDVALYLAKCLMCSKVKAENQKPLGLYHAIAILNFHFNAIRISCDCDSESRANAIEKNSNPS
ncbi:uncharacterized protein LOC143583818 [Bidens hawaiensis]|uniref:uncharacterized protein LOC143583818 n=1 Tax=Bidens hawaiensis TaxID=980011 RepID=UPI00404BA196